MGERKENAGAAFYVSRKDCRKDVWIKKAKKQHKAGKEKMMFDWRADGPGNGLTAP